MATADLHAFIRRTIKTIETETLNLEQALKELAASEREETVLGMDKLQAEVFSLEQTLDKLATVEKERTVRGRVSNC